MKMSQFIQYLLVNSGFLSAYILWNKFARQYLCMSFVHVGRLSVWCKTWVMWALWVAWYLHLPLRATLSPSLALTFCGLHQWISFSFWLSVGHLASGQYHQESRVGWRAKWDLSIYPPGLPSCWMSVNGQHSSPEAPQGRWPLGSGPRDAHFFVLAGLRAAMKFPKFPTVTTLLLLFKVSINPIHVSVNNLFFFFLAECSMVILVPWLRVEPMSTAVEAQSNPWTAREVPVNSPWLKLSKDSRLRAHFCAKTLTGTYEMCIFIFTRCWSVTLTFQSWFLPGNWLMKS